jgi:hypothetical protein
MSAITESGPVKAGAMKGCKEIEVRTLDIAFNEVRGNGSHKKICSFAAGLDRKKCATLKISSHISIELQ